MKMKSTLALLLITELYGLSSGLKQHYFVNQQKKWCSAQKYCKTNYHTLSTFINASEEERFLANTTNQTCNAWVGLYKNLERVWKWSGGIDAAQISWDTDPSMHQPNNAADENCAFLYAVRNKLHDEKCYFQLCFFCMTNFFLVRQRDTWDGALKYCKTHFKDLASVSTIQRMNSVGLEVSQAETEYVWIGLRYLAGDWFWLNEDDFDYTAWNQNQQPQCPARDLRCGALGKQTFTWTHRNCDEKLSFFCQ